MKKLVLLTSLLLTFFSMNAQTKWNISCTGKSVLKNVTEDPAKNIVTIKRSSLNKKGNLTISFASTDPESIRTIMSDDSARSGIKSWEKVTKPVTITNAALKKLVTGHSRIEFYYTAIPSDPAKAALVRVRPIHMFTLIVE